ncbi:MAG: sugar ABC transporter ATP-binding protein [Candidatus Methanomethylicaceae archaeon]
MKGILLEMKGICKSFPGVQALDRVNFDVFRNEIVGLVGENGAGKTTLMRILCGVYPPDRGEIILEGEKVVFKGPRDARRKGIAMVFQEQSILPNMTIAENLFLGCEDLITKQKVFSKREIVGKAKEILREFGLDFDPMIPVHRLSFAERQMIEIARNIWSAKVSAVQTPILVLDEPTTFLDEKEIETLFGKLREMRNRASIIYISHRLSEVVELCDRVHVLKDGRNAGTFDRSELSEDLLRSRMVGRQFEGEYYLTAEQRKPGSRILLEMRNCTKRGRFYRVSFQVAEGEIVSICGTVGSGKEELCQALFGLLKLDEGEILVDGRRVTINSPEEAISLGIGFVPEDRRSEGLILGLSVVENTTLPILEKLRRGVFVDFQKQLEITEEMIHRLRIKTPSPRTLCTNLSGGNQQKVVLSKWLVSGARILVMLHPTRGIDVGAKQEIYKLIRDLARQGIGMIILGDSFEEDIGLANKIVIMKDGWIQKILDANEVKPTPADVLQYVV